MEASEQQGLRHNASLYDPSAAAIRATPDESGKARGDAAVPLGAAFAARHAAYRAAPSPGYSVRSATVTKM